MAAVRDYPWGSIDHLRKADLAALRGLRGMLLGRIDPRSALDALARQTKARIDVRFRKSTTAVPDLAPGDVGVLLAPSDAPETTRAIFVAVEGLLASSLVARALEQKAPRIADAASAPAPAICGAFAALLARASRRDATTPLRVLAAGSAAQFARDLGASSGSFVGASFTVVVDDDAFLAHVLVARAHATTIEPAPWSREALAAAGLLPIAVPIVAATLTLTATEVAALRPGDALVIPEWPIREGRGPVHLAAGATEVGIAAEFETETRLVLRGEGTALPWSAPREGEEEPMTDRDPLADAVGDVPVVLRVEVGTVQLSAREWSQLGTGDVLTVGRRVKEPVSIRVSGVEVARGELVDVDGEVGVRILSRMKEGGG